MKFKQPKFRLHAGQYHDIDCPFPDVDEANCNCDLRMNKADTNKAKAVFITLGEPDDFDDVVFEKTQPFKCPVCLGDGIIKGNIYPEYQQLRRENNTLSRLWWNGGSVGVKQTKDLLLLVMNTLTDRWDEIELRDPDQSTTKWQAYKHIRNNIRDTIKEIAKSKGVEL